VNGPILVIPGVTPDRFFFPWLWTAIWFLRSARKAGIANPGYPIANHLKVTGTTPHKTPRKSDPGEYMPYLDRNSI